MKRFLTKCLLLLVLTAAILYAGGVAYTRTVSYRNLERQEETEKFAAVPEQIDVAVFGSSHGRNAFMHPFGETGFFNFSMSSQTPQYDEKMLQQFGGRLQEDALVVLTVSYISPFWTDSEEAFLSKQPRYYRVLDAENIVDVNLSKYYLRKFSPLLTEDLTSIVSAFLTNPPLVQDPAQLADRQVQPEVLPEDLARIRKDHIENNIDLLFPEVNPVMWQSYRNILSLCQERGWNAVLVTPPYLSAYNNCFSEDFYPVFYGYMEQLSEEFDVPYLDYSHYEDFAENYALFSDCDHLNLDGSAAFEALLLEDLAKLGFAEYTI